MPRVALVYNLPEEIEEYKTAMNGGRYACAIDDVIRYARSLRKYEERELIPAEEVSEMLYKLLSDLDE